MEEKDKSVDNLLSHVRSLQGEVHQLSGLCQQKGPAQPMVADLVREGEGEIGPLSESLYHFVLTGTFDHTQR